MTFFSCRRWRCDYDCPSGETAQNDGGLAVVRIFILDTGSFLVNKFLKSFLRTLSSNEELSAFQKGKESQTDHRYRYLYDTYVVSIAERERS